MPEMIPVESSSIERVGYDEETQELYELAREVRPHLVLHTGDVFDGLRPGYAEMTFAIEVLEELAAVAPFVVRAGNHDSPALFRLFDRLQGPEPPIRFVDRVRPPQEGGVFDLPAADGEIVRLACLPSTSSSSSASAAACREAAPAAGQGPAELPRRAGDRLRRPRTRGGRGRHRRGQVVATRGDHVRALQRDDLGPARRQAAHLRRRDDDERGARVRRRRPRLSHRALDFARREKEAARDEREAQRLDAACERLAKANVHPARDLRKLEPVLREFDSRSVELDRAERDTQEQEARLAA